MPQETSVKDDLWLNKSFPMIQYPSSVTVFVILKRLPVLQCTACREYLIEDAVMARIDTMLTRVDATAELEVIRYAA